MANENQPVAVEPVDWELADCIGRYMSETEYRKRLSFAAADFVARRGYGTPAPRPALDPATVEACAKICERAALRIVREGKPSGSVATFCAQQVRALLASGASNADTSTVQTSPLTRTQFIVQMVLAYARLYPTVPAERAMSIARTIYNEFISDEDVEFGDAKYAWDAAAASTIVHEYEGVDPLSQTGRGEK